MDVTQGGAAIEAGRVFYSILPDRFARSPRDVADGWDPAAFDPWGDPPRHRAYFGGSLRGIVDRLPDLAALGVDGLLLAPITASTTHHRYKPLDFRRVEPLLGGDAAFDELVAALRARRIALVLDLVLNHCGLGFPPFLDVLEYGAASPWREWFVIDRFPLDPWDPSLPPGYRCWNNTRSMPVLNHAHAPVRAFAVDVARHWLRRGSDGFRLDAASEVEARALWPELRAAVEAERPDAWILGESWVDPRPWLGAGGWHGATDYRRLSWLRRFVGGADLQVEHLHPQSRDETPIDAATFAAGMQQVLLDLPDEAAPRMASFLGTHDTARFRTVVGGDPRRAALGAVLLMTLPGVPVVLAGDEWGAEGGLPPASRICTPTQGDGALHALYRGLITRRRRSAALRRGRYQPLAAFGSGFAFERTWRDERVVVAVNTAREPIRLRLPDGSAVDLGPLGTWIDEGGR